MKPILYIKGDTIEDVRLKKFLFFFKKKEIPVLFWGWNRNRTSKHPEIAKEKYLISGGGFGNKKLIFYYQLWMIALFFKLLFFKDIKKYNIIAINFDSALPVYIISILRRFDYIYEVYDEFAISYNFPGWLKKILIKIDRKIMHKSKLVIHVDNNRLRYPKAQSIIIQNTPYDYLNGTNRNYDEITHTFAAIGMLQTTRGLQQIINFAQANKNIHFIFIGRLIDNKIQQHQLSSLENISHYDFMPQNEVFKLLTNCCAIFSLYDPTIEINRLAASNKVYDAMMMGIPVITNKEVINADYIRKQDIGYVINYTYDSTWDFLASDSFIEKAKITGEKGRVLYLKEYEFEHIVASRLMEHLS